MLRFFSRTSIVVLALSALALFPAVSRANVQGDWVLQLMGSGSNDKGFEHGAYQVDVFVGYFVTNNLQVNLSQGVAIASRPSSSAGVTQLSAFWNFPLNNQWDVYVGANVGLSYGTRMTGNGEFGPEAGVKFNINSTTYAFLDVQWDFSFQNSDFSEFLYSLGLGVKLN